LADGTVVFQKMKNLEHPRRYFPMHEDHPVAQLPVSTTRRRMPGLHAYLMLLLGAGFLCANAFWVPGIRPAAAQTTASTADFFGNDTCATCHEEIVRNFASNPHVKLAKEHGQAGITCESCHGAGRAHVDGGGDKTKIFNPAKATSKELNARCLSCHQDKREAFEHMGHGRSSVSCLACHSIHASGNRAHLLKAAQPQVCVNCHVEKAGPFVYEHKAISTEGCTSCHAPHGSPNPHMLNRADPNALCLKCHLAAPHNAAIMPAHAQAPQRQNCISCHSDIHGSNTSPFFMNSNANKKPDAR
jgi:predicted CXXCH cytochrome family protein